ncbi:MAG: hypothetical protein N3C63_04250 [Rhodocyclaceae bacterium]|nr:hypothetical protein [Rhodocyclaceae bacterium]
MTFDLPPTGDEEPPAFLDLEACRRWKEALPLGNPVQAQALLLRQLGLMNRYTLAADLRLMMLELLREPVYFVQAESAKKFTGKPLPLAPPEQAAAESAQHLWQALATGYLRSIEACLAGGSGFKPQAALVCQRALRALADALIDQVRAGRQVEAALWRRLHRVYAAAEALEATMTAIEDALLGSRPVTPSEVYVEAMLLSAASLHELSPRQQAWVVRWARRWAGKVVIGSNPPPESPALPLCVDLAGEAPARFKPYSGAGARWLETSELRKSLKKRLKLLAAGGEENTPARLGLGEDCTQPACGEVLRRIYPRWVKGGVLRRHERHPMSGACRFVVGVDAIHYYLSGHQPFKPPGSLTTEELRRQREELATFGRIAQRFEEDYSRNHGYQLENWEVSEDWGLIDQSLGGLKLARPLKQAGGRLAIGQLVAVQPSGASGFLLGAVRWAQIADETLNAGIQFFPGKPLPVALRGTGVMAAKEPWRPGFLLPPIEAMQLPPTAVLPPGSFKPGRILEAWTEEGSHSIRVLELLDRGADYERASCEEVAR